MSSKLLSEYLKENTKQFHDQVEAKFQSQKIFDNTFTIDDYCKVIWFNYLFHLNFEKLTFEKISDKTATALQMESRRKLHLLETDLKNLSIETSNPNEEFFVKNEAEAMGILYVMEGSSLGGNVIKKQLLQNPEFTVAGFNYFGCYGEKTGENWKRFKDILDHQIPQSQYPEVLTGAKKAYQFLLKI